MSLRCGLRTEPRNPTTWNAKLCVVQQTRNARAFAEKMQNEIMKWRLILLVVGAQEVCCWSGMLRLRKYPL